MNKSRDIVIDSFFSMGIQQICRVPIVAVYENPSDYPGKYVARLWDIQRRPTRYVMVKDDLESIRNNIPKTMKRMEPCPQDDPILVETWI
jgi:hypothetical protein